jgi:tetratricopeptide (TPR) repeat protein
MRHCFALLASLVFAALVRGADEPSSSPAPPAGTSDTRLEKLQEFIDSVEPWIGKYPPHFQDEKQKQQILSDTQKITDKIKTFDPDKISDVKLLGALGYILAMGHNLDLRCFTHARMFYDRALVVDPNNAHVNYLYGLLLISTDQFHYDALPYLQKALQEGEREAQISIAMLYYQKGDRTAALEQLEKYSAWGPAVNPKVKALIRSMKDGTLKFKAPAEEGKSTVNGQQSNGQQ